MHCLSAFKQWLFIAATFLAFLLLPLWIHVKMVLNYSSLKPECFFFPLWIHPIYEQAGGPTGTSPTGTVNVLSLLLNHIHLSESSSRDALIPILDPRIFCDTISSYCKAIQTMVLNYCHMFTCTICIVF